MLLNFFYTLKQYKVPVSVREYLDLLRALDAGLAFASQEEFYSLSRAVMVKDEKHFDKFDRAMKAFFDGLDTMESPLDKLNLPEDWLRKEIEKLLSPDELAELQKTGSLEKLMEEFQKRLAEQHKRHQGGNKMIGTGGTSPFGAYGANPEGIRLAGPSRNKSAVKVWEKREFKNLDDGQELGIRNMQVALRRLRRFARQGAAEELDIDDTIRSTAHNAGLLDIKMVPERRNRVKVLIFFDIGGSMDPYVKVCEALFSAARTEFKHLHYYYFHNFIYESVWQDNNRRWSERMPLWDVMHKYGPDYRVIFVGDATMSPYEIMSPGGSVEHFNEEAGAVWMQRLTQHFQKVVWLNPEPEKSWSMTQSVQIAKKLLEDRMYPLTLQGIEAATKYLSK
ncbi:hypothetical protein EV700_1315 [Fluviicoccus keumensis]|uniref:VWA domain containing CoxE-like protein n=1 Tax=Fluviicoccus keumensis TaxID=1435465 RepID=A0A4Q7ZAV3_9GAMM|nr:VWA domain-containing protein [Fluviicoccus keumensis]RZU46929.1 hypothetical protein EV700_1315 [Fluviicoccus keumensis]